MNVTSTWPASPSILKFMLLFVIVCGISQTLGAAVRSERAATTKASSSSANNPKTKSTVMHKNFENAGKKAGLEIWRIEDFEPKPYPKENYGKFYSGDSFIVLNTKEQGGKFSWDIHYWLGNDTSQDEAGSAAIFAVQLDDGLGGVPVQYREVQGHESDLFVSYFKGGVRYLPGGVASGFQHTEINPDGAKKLYQVKGKKNIRVTLVPVNVKSMNKGDCYILDSGKELFIYCGEKSKRTERLTAATVANEIRDEDHKGRAHVTKIEVGESGDEDVEKFFKELGSGSPKDVADAPATDDDEAFEKKQDSDVALYKVSDASGSLKTELISQKPLKQSLLKTDDCFILDTKTSGIYVWIGKKGTTQEKTGAMKNAEDFIKANKYPAWTQVTRVVEGGEATAFKKYFSDWREGSMG
ncbi:actin depolymerising venom protein gelsolin 1-like isoform X2 [Planococcus citri]